jgi:hypothetical protein
MRCRRQPSPTADESDDTDLESCFGTENEDSDPDTNPTDTDTDVEPDDDIDDDIDVSWLIKQDNVHPPEYYLKQEEEFDEGEFDTEDYKDNTLRLFSVIKGLWHR